MSVYKVIDIIGTSTQSWEDAAASAVAKARETLRDLRVAEVVRQDLDIGEDGGVTYRTRLSVCRSSTKTAELVGAVALSLIRVGAAAFETSQSNGGR